MFCLKEKKIQQDVTGDAGNLRYIGTLPSLASFFSFSIRFILPFILVVVSGDQYRQCCNRRRRNPLCRAYSVRITSLAWLSASKTKHAARHLRLSSLLCLLPLSPHSGRAGSGKRAKRKKKEKHRRMSCELLTYVAAYGPSLCITSRLP